jgi:hypothetical protein
MGMGYPTGKKTHAGTSMGKNLNPHAGMGLLDGRVKVSGCGYGMALPNGFLPIAISSRYGCFGGLFLLLLLSCAGSLDPPSTAFVRLLVLMHCFEQ